MEGVLVGKTRYMYMYNIMICAMLFSRTTLQVCVWFNCIYLYTQLQYIYGIPVHIHVHVHVLATCTSNKTTRPF